NLLIIILAGYETTANGLTYLIYMLAKHPNIQEKLRDEILREGHNTQYLEMVWMETLRLYPPVTLFVTREANQDSIVDDYYIEKGTIVQVPVWHIHHRSDIWEDPFTFDPQRFSAEKRKQIHPAAYLPFGLGSRVCIGVQMANLEVRTLISKLLRKFRIEQCEQSPDHLVLKCPTVIINPATPVYIKFVPI
ncbi:thromboxane A synthase-like protein, partial [Dinothrombium tinctorium]